MPVFYNKTVVGEKEMKLKYEILVDYNGKKIIYCTDCNGVFEYSEKLEAFIRACNENTDITEKSCTQSEIKLYKSCIDRSIYNYTEIIKNKYCRLKEKERVINRYTTLWINISNDCNLRCIYCYGDGGNYNKKRQIMNKKQLIEILDFWLEHADLSRGILRIIFFGGEPLINKQAIKDVVDYMNLNVKDNVVVKFGITTNGTILDDELLQIFSENYFNVTLSIDGGKEIQDINRPFADGKGSYMVLSNNIKSLRNKKIPIIARVTVTHENVKNLKKTFSDIWNLGITDISFDLVSTENRDFKLTEEDIDMLMIEIEELGKMQYEYVVSGKNRFIVNLFKFGRMLHKPCLNSCSYNMPDVLKVDVNGNIFKCHRLIGNDDFLEGNIKDKDVLKGENSYSRLAACEACNFSALCIPCYQANYRANKNIAVPDTRFCRYMQKLITENIRLYVSLRTVSEDLIQRIYE